MIKNMENLKKQIQSVVDIYKSGNLSRSEILTKKLIKANPKTAFLYNMLGLILVDQKKIDQALIDLDGTTQKKKIGANTILAVSIASSKLAAISKNISLFKYLGGPKSNQLPIPLMNIINGGVHANNSLRIQEFMIRPEKVKKFSESMRICFLIIQKLKTLIRDKNLSTAVGDEGGFAPSLNNNEKAIEFILEAIEKSGFKIGKDVCVCLDVAANELFKDKKYVSKSPGVLK